MFRYAFFLSFIVFIVLGGCRKEKTVSQKNTILNQNCNPNLHQPLSYVVAGVTHIYVYNSNGSVELDSATSGDLVKKLFTYSGDKVTTISVDSDQNSQTDIVFYSNNLPVEIVSYPPTNLGSLQPSHAYITYNSNQQLEKWNSERSNGPYSYYSITDSIVYDSLGNIIKSWNWDYNTDFHEPPATPFNETYEYYYDHLYQGEFDPKVLFYQGSPRPKISMPQTFSRNLLKSRRDTWEINSHYYSYKFNQDGSVSEITDSDKVGVTITQINYCH